MLYPLIDGDPIRPDLAPLLNNPQIISAEPYCAIDASGWYWCGGSSNAQYCSINKVIKEGDLSLVHSRKVTKAINGAYSQADERWQHTVRIFEVFDDIVK